MRDTGSLSFHTQSLRWHLLKRVLSLRYDGCRQNFICCPQKEWNIDPSSHGDNLSVLKVAEKGTDLSELREHLRHAAEELYKHKGHKLLMVFYFLYGTLLF